MYVLEKKLRMEEDLKVGMKIVRFSNLKSEICNYFQLKLFGVPVHYLRQRYVVDKSVSCLVLCSKLPSVKDDVQGNIDVL